MEARDKQIPYYNPKLSFIGAIIENINFREHSIKNFKETIIRYSKRTSFVRKIFGLDKQRKRGNLSVFVIRHNALEIGLRDLISKLIEINGFVVLANEKIEKRMISFVSKKTRGGNWSTVSPSKVAKGYPEAIIVAFDPNPKGIPRSLYKNYPEIDNGRLAIKIGLRALLNTYIPDKLHSNFLHVTDYEEQAWKYIKIVKPELETYIKAKTMLNFPQCPKCGPKIFLINKDKYYNCRNCSFKQKIENFSWIPSKGFFLMDNYIKPYTRFVYLSIRWFFLRFIQRIKRERTLNPKYYNDPFKPADKNYPFNPNKIEYFYNQEKNNYHFKKIDMNLVIGGDWETTTTELEFDNSLIYNSALERFVHGKDWIDTDYFKHKIELGLRKKNLISQIMKFQSLDNLYYDMKNRGYKSQRELSFPNARAFQGWGEIAIFIGRDGTIYLSQGRHRAAFAKIIGIVEVLANIVVRHQEWFDFRQRIINYAKNNEDKINYTLEHVDLQFIPSHCDGSSFQIIRNALPSNTGNISVLGAHWGYFCNKLESIGFRCVAVEDNPIDRYFLKKFKKMESNRFTIIEDYAEISSNDLFLNSDIVLALDILHKFWIDPNRIRTLSKSLKRTKAKSLFFQHTLTKKRFNIINKEVRSDEIINFVIDHSHFTKYEEIGKSSEGVPIWKLEV